MAAVYKKAIISGTSHSSNITLLLSKDWFFQKKSNVKLESWRLSGKKKHKMRFNLPPKFILEVQ